MMDAKAATKSSGRQPQHTAATAATPSRPTAPAICLCPRCQGHKTEKELYNACVVLERTCGACDGLGVLLGASSA